MTPGSSGQALPQLPAGICRELQPKGSSTVVVYVFTCRKDGKLCGQRTVDRVRGKMPQALRAHADCRPEWDHLQQLEDEARMLRWLCMQHCADVADAWWPAVRPGA